MRRALRLAARGRTSPNPMVGAVVVREGRIVGEGFHPRAGEPHAEVFALRAAGELARGAELYVTLEPCCHHGRTPPCTETVISSGVRRVFAAMRDPNPLVAGKGLEALRAAGVEVSSGLLGDEAAELNRGFIKRVTAGLPFVLWKAAMTLDGKTATRSGDSRWVTGEGARRQVHRLRDRSDAVLVGIGTVRADDPQLTVRGVRGAVNPMRVVVDARAEMPPGARVLSPGAETVIAAAESAPPARVEALRAAGARVLTLPETDGRVDLRALMRALAGLGVNSVLLEGGGELAASMLAEGLIDRGLVFIAPKIVGGRAAGTPVGGEGIEFMRDAILTSKPKIRRCGGDVALEFELG